MQQFDFSGRMSKNKIESFVSYVNDRSKYIGFKVSARGWCYLLEGDGVINKSQFDKVEGWIKAAREKGHLPIDFTASESAREFQGVEVPHRISPVNFFGQYIQATVDYAGDWYNPNWWEGEEYYIQLVVEKVDLLPLFSPICEKYHIALANSKGWSSQMQRAEYCRRFKEAESNGLQCVLLYGGDLDPDGERISDNLKSNLEDLEQIIWEDGESGYDPASLIVDRFCLNLDFVEANGLTWIDNLKTGSKKKNAKPLDDPGHKNHFLPYVQDYLKRIGPRKCEATALVTIPQTARDLIEDTILGYLGKDAEQRFEDKAQVAKDEIAEFVKRPIIADSIKAIKSEVELAG